MAERQRPYPHQQPGYDREQGIKGMMPEKGALSTSQILAVVTLVPLGGFLLFLAGGTLVLTLIGLAVSTPLFLLFSPVLVPAALVIGAAVVGFLASGAFGITGLSSVSWIANYIKQMRGTLPQQMEMAKKRMQETAGQVGQKAREAGQQVMPGRGQEGGGVRGQEIPVAKT